MEPKPALNAKEFFEKASKAVDGAEKKRLAALPKKNQGRKITT